MIQAIEKSDIITVFRHVNPDSDALGSQWALVWWIQQHYPEKQVYACGFFDRAKGLPYPAPDSVSDEVIKASVAIVLDTANIERIDDMRYELAHTIIRIDHHPKTSEFGDIEWIDTTSPATCQMLASWFRSMSPIPLSKKVAQALMAGITSDTVRFSINKVNQETFEIAAYLLSSGIDLTQINNTLFSVSLDEFKFINHLRYHAKVLDCGLGYAMVDLDTCARFNIHPNIAKEFIYALADVDFFKVWAIFIEIEVDGKTYYNGSLRSRSTPINDIAMQYGGGGHPLAAAVRHVTKEQTEQILQQCCARIGSNIE